MFFTHQLPVLLIIFFIMRIFKFNILKHWGKPVSALFIISISLSLTQYFLSNYTEYTNDIYGHTGYITYIAQNGELPLPFGWQTQQPPLYYMLGALFYKFGQWFNLPDPLYATRILSLILYVSFLILSLNTLRHYLKGVYFVMAAAIVLFWPDGFTYAGRISTDVGILFIHALVFYLITRWHFNKQQNLLLYACYAALTGLLIKSSAVIGVGAVAAMIAFAILKKELKIQSILKLKLIVFAALVFTLNFGRIAYYRFVENENVKWFINLELSQITHVLVPNTPYNYLYFDIKSFLRDPFFFSIHNGGEFFLNAFLKTLLFGEWFWKAGPIPAGIISGLLLVILLFIITYILLKAKPTQKSLCFPALIMMLCMIGALIAARIEVPWPAQSNGRYIFGVIVMFALFFSKAVEWHKTEGRTILVGLAVLTTIVFCAVSTLMIIIEFYPRL